MPDLPTPLKIGVENKKYDENDIDWNVDMLKLDKEMFDTVLNDPDLQADQWKIYPTSIVPYTKIKKDFERGLYKPYFNSRYEDFVELLVSVKNRIHPWIRINRLIRDIPSTYIIGGNNITNLRDVLSKRKDCKCKCIRCREIKREEVCIKNATYLVEEYKSSDGIEYFISLEDTHATEEYKTNIGRKTIYGFLRLRIDKNIGKDLDGVVIFPEIVNTSIIRELHIYGNVQNKDTIINGYQNKGIGKKLIKIAEEITIKNGLNKISVISGIGVKNYYIKQGFEELEHYLVKNLDSNQDKTMYNYYLYVNFSLLIILYVVLLCKIFLYFY